MRQVEHRYLPTLGIVRGQVNRKRVLVLVTGAGAGV